MNIEKSLELASKATPGPWHVEADCELEGHIVDSRGSYLGSFDETHDAQFIADAREGYPEALRRLKAIGDLLTKHGVWDHELQPDENDNEVDRATFVSLCGEHAETLRSLLSLDGKDGA